MDIALLETWRVTIYNARAYVYVLLIDFSWQDYNASSINLFFFFLPDVMFKPKEIIIIKQVIQP